MASPSTKGPVRADTADDEDDEYDDGDEYLSVASKSSRSQTATSTYQLRARDTDLPGHPRAAALATDDIAGPAATSSAASSHPVTPTVTRACAAYSSSDDASPTTGTTDSIFSGRMKPAPRPKGKHPFGQRRRDPNQDRTSFSSVKEQAGTLAQAFTDSKISSLVGNETALEDYGPVDDGHALIGDEEEAYTRRDGDSTRALDISRQGDGAGSSDKPSPPGEQGLLIVGGSLPGRAQSATHLASVTGGASTNPATTNVQQGSFLSPCPAFLGWKKVPVMGRIASKSYGDLSSLGMGWQWEVHSIKEPCVEVIELGQESPAVVDLRLSSIEMLPLEILTNIIDQLHIDLPPNNFSTRNADLMSLLLTSRTLHSVTLATLYSKVTIPHSRIFHKFLSHIKQFPALGTIVRRLDFSHFNPTGTSMTARERKETPFLIPATLLQCLDLTPNLREFLVQEHADDDLDAKVIQKLLCDLPNLKAVDFCACTGSAFTESFTHVFDIEPTPLPTYMSITRLCLHECSTLPTGIFEKLIPRLVNLTHLDVSHTRVNDAALLSIAPTARLTHLNLSKCSRLTSNAVLDFMQNHPAARTLIYLNLAMDAKSAELLYGSDILALIPLLPNTLRSLNLKGSKMDSTHITPLIPLTFTLEELGLGRHLTLFDLVRLFTPSATDAQHGRRHTLHYLDISDLSASDLDMGMLLHPASCSLLSTMTKPLQVLELGTDVGKKLDRNMAAVRRIGWCLMEAGWRAWLVRDEAGSAMAMGHASGNGPSSANQRQGAAFAAGQGMDGNREREQGPRRTAIEEARDSGARSWKWGATYWGMRKVPVARSEVGGMYGHYMFKR